MTEPGLGSGALREALEKIIQDMGFLAAYAERTRDGVAPDAIRMWASQLAALSLSSPIEPSRVITEMREFAKECLRRIKATPRVDGNELHTKETYADILILCAIAEDVERARPPQASSEIREARLRELQARLDENIIADTRVCNGQDLQMHRKRKAWLTAQIEAEVAALAPSRQGAGGK